MAGPMDGLLEKRREIVERRRKLKGELTRLARDVAAIDRVLRMVEPGYVPEASGRSTAERHAKFKNPFPAGQMVPAILEALRLLDRPATSAECAAAMFVKGGHDVDGPTMAKVVNRVSALLAQKVGGGQVERAGHADGREVLWRIAV